MSTEMQQNGPQKRAYSGPGKGSTVPAVAPSVVTTAQTLKEWSERCGDQPVCWLVLRLIHCKLYWLSLDGGYGRKQRDAAAWREREDAYQAARAAGGLLYCYDRET